MRNLTRVSRNGIFFFFYRLISRITYKLLFSEIEIITWLPFVVLYVSLRRLQNSPLGFVKKTHILRTHENIQISKYL